MTNTYGSLGVFFLLLLIISVIIGYVAWVWVTDNNRMKKINKPRYPSAVDRLLEVDKEDWD